MVYPALTTEKLLGYKNLEMDSSPESVVVHQRERGWRCFRRQDEIGVGGALTDSRR